MTNKKYTDYETHHVCDDPDCWMCSPDFFAEHAEELECSVEELITEGTLPMGHTRCGRCGEIDGYGPAVRDDLWLAIAEEKDLLCAGCIWDLLEAHLGRRPNGETDLADCPLSRAHVLWYGARP